MRKIYTLDGKVVDKKDIGKDAELVQIVYEEHYETPEYRKQQSIKASEFFKQLRENREGLEQRHG